MKLICDENWLKNNPYPGRGIVMGFGPAGERVQIYWIMGRSENSKNRIFVQNKDGSVSTKAFDEKKVTDPSLIIYNLLKNVNGTHIISNGDQTDTIAEFLAKGKSFEEALKTRTYEPDAPNYTPRISGVFYPNGSYALSILKASSKENPKRESIFAEKECGEANIGEMLTTYEGEEDPLVSFIGLPKKMPIKNTAQETLEFYWNMLNPKYRVSILVNWIENEKNEVFIKNEHTKCC
ncbi:MAG: IMP cyclohydrolase [Fibromonadaceae bacterium]|jgi:IMP cyclohydrolase|nr:IMP cyclohydrolase [Fibromonadaceae bacterium]